MDKLQTIRQWDAFITDNFNIQQRMVGDMDIFYTLDTSEGGAEIMLTYTHDTDSIKHEVLLFPNRDKEESIILASFYDKEQYTREDMQHVIR